MIDSHCHTWASWPYEPFVPDPDQRATVEQLLYEMDTHGVERATIVCARIGDNVENNRYVADAVARHPDRLHQFADLDSHWSNTHHVDGAADRLRRLADELQPSGITHYVRGDDDGWLVSGEGFDMFEVAAERGLLVSLAAPPQWQPSVRRVARRFESLPIICHHLGGLRPHVPEFRQQMDEFRASADVPNILVKLSGWRYASQRSFDYPYLDVLDVVRFLYQNFGARRLCWGSNHPVERPFTTYRQTIEVIRQHCDFIAPDDLGLILGETLGSLLSGERQYS